MQSSPFVIHFLLAISSLSFSNQDESGSIDDLSLAYLKWKYKHDHTESETVGLTSAAENLLDPHGDIHNSSQVYEDCQAFIKEFAKQASRFIECSIDNARPFRFCEGCVVHYKKAKTVYNDIKLNDEKKNNCQKLLLNSDRVQVINNVYQDFENIWTSADCERCFEDITEDNNGTVKYPLRQTTIKFLNLYSNFTKCVPSNTTGYHHNNTICQICATYYNQMNSMFDKLLNDKSSPQHVCMDIVDMMNYTRLLWGDTLNCTKFHKDYAPVLLIAVGFLSMPPVFYICMKVYGTKKEKEIIRQKRLSIYNQDNTFNYTIPSVSDPQLSGENSVHHGNTGNSTLGPARKRPNPIVTVQTSETYVPNCTQDS